MPGCTSGHGALVCRPSGGHGVRTMHFGTFSINRYQGRKKKSTSPFFILGIDLINQWLINEFTRIDWGGNALQLGNALERSPLLSSVALLRAVIYQGGDHFRPAPLVTRAAITSAQLPEAGRSRIRRPV